MTRLSLSPILLLLLLCVHCCGQDTGDVTDRDTDKGPIKLMQQRVLALNVTGTSEKL